MRKQIDVKKNNYPSPRYRIAKCQHSFLQKALKLWNQLEKPTETKYNSFKKEMDKRKPIENPLVHLGNRKEKKNQGPLKIKLQQLERSCA